MLDNNYFYSHEAEQFTFYRIPKTLFTNEKYKKMNTDAKVLYGLLLDRVSLSIKNNWVDELQRVYIIFTRGEAQEYLNVKSDTTISKLFKELKKYGLIEEIRQGLNKPNIIFVKKFIESVDTTRNSKKWSSATSKNGVQQLQKMEAINTECIDTECIDNSVSQDIEVEQKETDRQTDITQNEFKDYKQTIEQSQLEDVNSSKGDRQALEQAMRLLYFNKTGINQGNSHIPYQLIREDMKKINQFVLEHALKKFEKASRETQIKNTIAYLSACIYDSIYSMTTDIDAELRHSGII